jgi:hypothetical protein
VVREVGGEFAVADGDADSSVFDLYMFINI